MKRKSTRFGSLLVALAMLLSGCATSVNDSTEARQETWLAAAQLDAEETPEALYEAALQENTLVVYSTSTRVYDTKAYFEAAYPGLTVDIQIIRAADILPLLGEVFPETGAICDLLICPDINAALSAGLAANGVLYKYVPYDMADQIAPAQNDDILGFMVEGAQLFYNSEAFDAPPVSNWWELIEPRFENTLYMVDPLRSYTTSALICAMIQRSDEMEAAYFDLYGKALEVPEGSTAGQEYWRLLLQNGLQFTSSSEEALELVGMPGQTEAALGIMVSSKIRKAEIGYSIAPVYDIAPSTGVFVANSVMVAGGAENIHAAKLFIRFLLGESDGHGLGYTPFLEDGSWSVRYDVPGQAKVPMQESGFWTLDKQHYLENNGWIMDWWSALRGVDSAH